LVGSRQKGPTSLVLLAAWLWKWVDPGVFTWFRLALLQVESGAAYAAFSTGAPASGYWFRFDLADRLCLWLAMLPGLIQRGWVEMEMISFGNGLTRRLLL